MERVVPVARFVGSRPAVAADGSGALAMMGALMGATLSIPRIVSDGCLAFCRSSRRTMRCMRRVAPYSTLLADLPHHVHCRELHLLELAGSKIFRQMIPVQHEQHLFVFDQWDGHRLAWRRAT